MCYDLRFPVWSRNVEQYDLAVYVANWPAARVYPWSTLLKARAIENQCYVIGSNRVGKDGNDIEYVGGSAIIEPKGSELEGLYEGKEGVLTATLEMTPLESYRAKFPVGDDADSFQIT